MRCLYCDKEIVKVNYKNILFEDDLLCVDCRKKLRINRKYVDLKEIKVETMYDYEEGIFKNLLMQYKECYDEALAKVFLYLLTDYINVKYHGYKMILVPSSDEKIRSRGFNHLELIYRECKLPIIDGIRMKQDYTQEGKNYDQRKTMIDNYIYDGELIDKALIVDDVLTSGSSILGVYRAIAKKASKIRAFSLSRKENAFNQINKCDRMIKRRII